MEAIETFTHNGKFIEIHVDSDAQHCNPRENSNLGTFWTQERRRTSPDAMEAGRNVFSAVADKFGGIETAESNAKALDKACVWLPVWCYEHSGIAYRAAPANPFHCPWDSGQVGYVFVSREDVRKEYGVKRISAAVKAKALEVLKAEVEEYSKYANGECYGFRVLDEEDGEELDSCWGFLGFDYVKEAATEAAE
ncbi:hypothetical protein RPALISO_231 [Ruegeria phage RpAliso]|nr:hypothetical protein RPALISO_231 [Ruegeria phage RpAliso]